MTPWYPHVTVATVVERDGRFLLVEENTSEGIVLNQPAGHLDPGETLHQAAVRETLEETGWHVELDSVIGVALYTAPANGITYHRTTFSASALRQDPSLELDEGIIRCLWLSYEEIQQESARLRSPLVLKSIEQYRSGISAPLDFIYHS